ANVRNTDVGKTDFSIKLAKQFNGEINKSDSMKVYKDMEIDTAKITKEESEGISHHLIDILEPTDAYSAADFKRLCLEQIEDIQNRNKLPIIVGGRSEEHTSELQSRFDLVCRLLLVKKK